MVVERYRRWRAIRIDSRCLRDVDKACTGSGGGRSGR